MENKLDKEKIYQKIKDGTLTFVLQTNEQYIISKAKLGPAGFKVLVDEWNEGCNYLITENAKGIYYITSKNEPEIKGCGGCGEKKTNDDSLLVTTGKVNYPDLSCKECVEKHICTAKAYCKETYSGYPKKRRDVIGELVCAEHESLSLGSLSQLIRKERKEFSTNNICPNFDILLDKLEKITEEDGNGRK